MIRSAADPVACPGRDDLSALVDDRLDDSRREALLDHLRGCPACAAVIEGFAAGWSLADRSRRPADQRGTATRAFEARLRALDPAGDGGEGVPVIPGYRDLAVVARGGMGIVYRAIDEALGRPVALKLLAAARLASPTVRLRAEREALTLARSEHPGVVRVLATGVAAGLPWIAMEWIDGETLGRRIGRAALPHREAARIARELAWALERVHAAGIVHRDIKPDNVLLARAPREGDPPVPKLVDFGLARPDDTEANLTQAAAPLGTPAFMAPEQTGRDPALGAVGPATDIHGVGATPYCMLTGRAPYHGADTSAALVRAAAGDAAPLSLFAPGVPLDLRTITEACLRREPGRRYPSAAALADDLTRFLDGLPIRARATGPVERCLKWARRRPAVAAALVAVVIAVGAGVAGTAYHVARLRAAHADASQSRDAALAARELARRSFQRLTDGSAERLLVRGQALDQGNRDHLRHIREEYRNWPLEPDVAAGLRFRITGLRRVGMLFARLARPEEMLETIGMALEAIDDMERRGLLGPAEERLRHEFLRAPRSALIQAGRLDEAAAATREEIARLAVRVGVVPALAPHLASAHGDLASILDAQGNHSSATDHFRRALDRFDALAADPAAEPVPAHLEMSVRFNAAISPPVVTDSAALTEQAGRLVERARAILASATSAEDRAAAGRGLLVGLRLLAQADIGRGQPQAALDVLRRLTTEAADLAAEAPDETYPTDEVVGAVKQMLHCHTILGHPADAAADVAALADEAERRLADEPASLARAVSLVKILEAEAEITLTVADHAAALPVWRRIVAVLDPWLTDAGADAHARKHALYALRAIASGAQARGQRAAAAEALRQTLPLVAEDERPAIEAELAALEAPRAAGTGP